MTIERLQPPRRETEIFRSTDELDAFLDRMHVAVAAPRVDFDRETAALLALGPRSSAGYEIEVMDVEEQRGRVLVVVRERSTPGAPARVAYPFAFVVFRETGKPVAVDWR